jgi:hypothetical protein
MCMSVGATVHFFLNFMKYSMQQTCLNPYVTKVCGRIMYRFNGVIFNPKPLL